MSWLSGLQQDRRNAGLPEEDWVLQSQLPTSGPWSAWQVHFHFMLWIRLLTQPLTLVVNKVVFALSFQGSVLHQGDRRRSPVSRQPDPGSHPEQDCLLPDEHTCPAPNHLPVSAWGEHRQHGGETGRRLWPLSPRQTGMNSQRWDCRVDDR